MAHIFISYSSIDRGWVEKLHMSLEKELRSRVDPQISIWRDEKLHGGDRTDDVILGEVRKARIFLAVLSKAWLGSDYCRKELAESRDLPIGIEKVPVEQEELPSVFRESIRRKFHSEGSTHRPGSRSFLRTIETLAEDIKHHLKTVSGFDLDGVVAEVRALVQPDIRERCDKMRILTMQQSIELSGVYTEVNILEKITGHQRKSVDELIEEILASKGAEVNRLNMGMVDRERIPGAAAIKQHKRLMILGKPGAGKTTFLKHLAVECASGRLMPEMIPVFITLKDFAETKGHPTLPDYVRDKWAGRAEAIALLRNGRALILLDGLDEVQNQDFGHVRKQIDDFAKTYAKCPIALTCRIAAREFVFESFTEVEMADFNYPQIAAFAKNWFMLRDHPEKAGDFLAKLEANASVRELASSPLLTTLLCLVFEERTDFEGTRAELYREGLEILLRKWDASRHIERDRPYRNLTPGQKESLLADIAYRRFSRGEYFFDQSSLERQIEEFLSAREFLEIGEELRPTAILNAIEAQHGILIARAHRVYSFSHLTFQEYLAAQRLSRSPDIWAESASRIGDHRWREVFLLLVTMIDPDQALQRLKQQADNLVAGDTKLQGVLAWAQRKSTAARTRYKPAGLRLYYVALGRALALARTLYRLGVDRVRDLNFALARDLALAHDFDGALARDRVLDLARVRTRARVGDLDSDLALDLALTLALGRDLGPGRDLALDRTLHLALDLAKAVASGLVPEIDQLRQQTPEKITGEWWNTMGTAWTRELCQAMIRHRDLGHDWGLTEAESERLDSYVSANRLLIDCMKATPGLTKATRQWVEHTMLLPQSELAQYPPPRA